MAPGKAVPRYSMVAWTLPYCSTLLAISTPMMENVAISMMTPWMQATLAMDLMPPETV